MGSVPTRSESNPGLSWSHTSLSPHPCHTHDFRRVWKGISHELLLIIWYPTFSPLLFWFSWRMSLSAAFKWHATAAQPPPLVLIKALAPWENATDALRVCLVSVVACDTNDIWRPSHDFIYLSCGLVNCCLNISTRTWMCFSLVRTSSPLVLHALS